MRVTSLTFRRIARHFPKTFVEYASPADFPLEGAAARGVDPSVKEAVRSHHIGMGGPPDSVDRLLGGAPAVITGQQPSPLLGPLYNLYKAISAIRLAESCDAVPVFWVHTDDHNAAAVARVTLPDPSNNLQVHTAELPPQRTPLNRWSPSPFEIEKLFPPTEFREEVMKLMAEDELRPMGERFARILLRLFGDRGLVVVEPRCLYGDRAARLLDQILERPTLVRETTRPERDPGTGIFVTEEDRRRRLAEGERPSGPWSAGVALRPVLQDLVLPVAATVAGPHEVEYLSRLDGLYQALGVERSAVVPRISATLVEEKIARSMKGAGLSLEGVLAGGREETPGVVPWDSTALESVIEEHLKGVGGKSLEALRKKTREKVARLLRAFGLRVGEEKVRQEQREKSHENKVRNHLLPGGELQERVLNPSYYLCRYGTEGMKELLERLDPRRFEHQVVWL